MSAIKTAIKGTADILPQESYKWQQTEKTLFETAEKFGFSEIRTPVFENTDLFLRSVGDTTDVVNKEMYTFEDKGGRSVTLRPEITAGVVRSFLEHGLFNDPLPIKMCYASSCYRYEKPQAGRMREFHQFGAEMFGSESYLADCELIMLAKSLLENSGVKNARLNLNSIGCHSCRAEYQKELKRYFELHKDELCGTCLERLERNPMRILDCKSEVCGAIAKKAPKMIDYLCSDCREHFDGVRSALSEMNVEYIVNPDIVRGLDYYTRTVFEFVSDCLGAQSTVLGGGRYDGLVAQLGGSQMPALGFAMGLERLMLILEAQQKDFGKRPTPLIYIASMGEKAARMSLGIVSDLRSKGIFAELDTMGRSVKSSMKYANKLGARYTVVLGDSELECGRAVLKDMLNKDSREIELENLYNELLKEE